MYKAGIIGLGNIAAKYNSPEDDLPYCHVGGIRHSSQVKLDAVADLAEPVRENFRSTWGGVFPDTKYYPSAIDMLASENLDIVAVCVRGPDHFPVTMDVIKSSPKAIFLEKPPSCSLQEMDTMIAAAQAKSIPIIVSYSRHWCPHVLRLQELIHQGLIGEVTTVVGYIGHPFLSFASHVTDLICQFAGYCPVAVFARGRVEVDDKTPAGYEPEPVLDTMIIEFENGVTGIQVGTTGEHGGFYAEVFGSAGYVRAGIYIPPAAFDKDGKPIDLTQHNMPANASVFQIAYDQIADYLAGGPLPHCTNDDWIAVNEVGFAGIESVLTDYRIVLPNQHRSRKIFANG